MKKDATFVYIVGGNEEHYTNLHNSIRSIKRLIGNAKIKVFEFGNKLTTCADYVVVNQPELDFSKKKVGYQFWRQKYYAAINIDTEWGVYVDSDTVLANDIFDSLFDQLNGKIGSAQHFYVPTISAFFYKAVPAENHDLFLDLCNEFDVSSQATFFSGGVFLFQNTEENKTFFAKLLEAYDTFYLKNDQYVKGITDEVFFSMVDTNRTINLGGHVNHCSMGEEHMHLKLNEETNTLEGKNPFDNEFKPVLFLHCDINRRDPSQSYEGALKSLIIDLFHGEQK